MLRGDRAPPRVGERATDSVSMLLDRAVIDGGVMGLPPGRLQKLLLRVLLAPEDPLVELLVSDRVLILRLLLKKCILLTGGELFRTTMGVLQICDSGAA
jgi:hypothetical protein